jgi:hypothetical protein
VKLTALAAVLLVATTAMAHACGHGVAKTSTDTVAERPIILPPASDSTES